MQASHKSIAITGASGFIAKNLRKRLSSDYSLTSFSRNNFTTFENETRVITDYDESHIVSYLQNCDVLIHLIGTGKQDIHSQYYDINTKITTTLLDACKSTSIKQIIYLSGLGVSPKNTSNYFISKYHAEQSIINSGIDYTIFRPSYIIGKNDYLTKSIDSQIKKGKILIPGTGQYVMQPILVSDVVDILKSSFCEIKFSNKIIDLVGPEKFTFEKYLKLFSKNHKTIKIPIEECIKNALTDPNFVYGLDDLNILLGGFIGDFEKLDALYDNTIHSVTDLL